MYIYKSWNLCGKGSTRPAISLLLLMCMVVAGGCNNIKYNATDEAKYQKPTIAVMSFENRAPVNTRWQLGEGLADQLINRLIQTRRYVVLERQQLQAIMAELKRSEDSKFRSQGKPQLGRLKHVRYLVKGTITDFGHVETVEGFWKLFDWGLAGSSSHSIVAATLHVIDIQSGQVIASTNVQAKIKDSKDKEKVTIENMAFGSYTFYHTTLGQATSKMLEKAVKQIAQAIAECPYQPKIASIINKQVIINGGKDRRIKPGDQYLVRPPSNMVVDPDSGDILGHITGQILGQIRVIQVTDKYSIAQIIKGNQFTPGQSLFKIDAETARGDTEVTPY